MPSRAAKRLRPFSAATLWSAALSAAPIGVRRTGSLRARRGTTEEVERLQQVLAVQRRLERLVLDERSLDEVVQGLATSIRSTVIVVDGTGRTLAAHAVKRQLDPGLLATVGKEIATRARTATPDGFVLKLSTDRATALPVPNGSRGAATSWLIIMADGEGVAELERFHGHHAVTVVALAQMRERIVAETERRLAREVLIRALSGELRATDVRAQLATFEMRGDATVLVLAGNDPGALEGDLAHLLGEVGVRALVATVPTARRPLLCGVLQDVEDAISVATVVCERLSVGGRSIRAAVSHRAPLTALRQSFHEARCALEVGGLGKGPAPTVASADDLGPYRLLLSTQDNETVRQYCDDVLSPITRTRTGNSDELLRSLDIFLEHNGSWEAAARALYCHRHTLRYRITRIEELTGRRLDRVENRIEFWLALRGRELLGAASGHEA